MLRKPRPDDLPAIGPDQRLQVLGKAAGLLVLHQNGADLPVLHHKIQHRLKHRSHGPVLHRLPDMGVDQRLGLSQQLLLHAPQQLGSVRIMQVEGGAVHIRPVRHIPD